MPISSLPSDYGIGTFGQAAYDFADYLERSGQSVWQILPVSPTGFGDSPYASYSTFAGNPYFIDLDMLARDGLLYPDEYRWIDWGSNPEQVDYGKIYNNRLPVLRKAVERFLHQPDVDYEAFKKREASWLDDYALFTAIKANQGGKGWMDWDEPYHTYTPEGAKEWAKEFADEIEVQKVIQYLFFKQWKLLKNYVNKKGIKIIGDIPIYVAMDSVDTWAHPELFALDENREPTEIAGCPPDAFNDEGQMWGNPLYDWEAQKKDGYSWWIDRIEHMSHLYDILRIDHFRGFDSYYAIKKGAVNGKEGKWMKGPGMDFFNAMRRRIDEPEIIVEDLGDITPSVRKLLRDTGYPGMKVLEFAFNDREGERSEYIPYNYPKNCVAYTGTHDNDTIQGWIENTKKEDLEFAKDFMHSYSDNPEVLHWDMIRTLLASAAATTILQAQDLKALGKWSRMNQPATVGSNWAWRMKKGALDEENEKWVRHIVETYGRLPEKKKDETKKA